MANTTWNPSDLSAVTLSGGNLIATATGAGWVRAADKQATGKFYWEFTPTVWASANTAHGIAQGSVTPSGAAPAGMFVVYKSGAIWLNNANSGSTLGALVAGNVIGVAIDLGAQLGWFRLAPLGNWNGSATANPVTGAGGVFFASISGVAIAVYPVVAFGASAEATTANFGGSAFTGAVPSGFTSGFTSGASIPNSALATQVSLEQFLTTPAPAQVTQVALEHWVTTATITGQALVTQVALEQWARVDLPPSGAQARVMVMA